MASNEALQQPQNDPPPKQRLAGMRFSWKHLGIIAAAFVGVGIVGLAVNSNAIFASSGQRFNDAVYSASQQTRDARRNLEAISADMIVIHNTASGLEPRAAAMAGLQPPGRTPDGAIRVAEAPASPAGNGNIPVRSYSDSEGTDGATSASGAAREPGETGETGRDAEKVETEPETLQDRAAKLLGDRRSENQLAAQRLVDNWQPRYEAAKAGHHSLALRVADTREFWEAYYNEQADLINSLDPNIPSHRRWREQTIASLREDRQRWLRWDAQAQEVLSSSRDAIVQLEGMNIAIAFYRNKADFAAVTVEVLELAPTVSLLVNDLSTFEEQTARLALAISDTGPAQ